MRLHNLVLQRAPTRRGVSEYIRKEQAADHTVIHASVPSAAHRQSCNTPEGATCSPTFPADYEPILTCQRPQTAHPEARRRMDADTTGRNRFPLSNFKYFLTLFSKCFSSFPHGTCSLSVSRPYLALDGIYHPFRAAVPSNSTRRKRIMDDTDSRSRTGFSPSLIPCSNGFIPGPGRTTASIDYNSVLD